MKTLTFDEFLRSLKQNLDTPHAMLLGAGASIESNIPSAIDCVWDWKAEIFFTQNPSARNTIGNVKMDNTRLVIQNWLDGEQKYPKKDSADEYSFFAEKAFPIEEDRKKYFQNLTKDKKPSLGYHLLSMLAEKNWLRSVWTTNFDGLMIKASNGYNLTPIEVTLESQNRIYRNDTLGELVCVALHGDYKYGSMKNTTNELDTQDDIFQKALKHEVVNRNLIVIGYSGRDKSLMNALSNAFQQPGAGRLYWCGYGSNCSKEVEDLLDSINSNGRLAYYVPANGFDETMLMIASHCMDEDKDFISRIGALKKVLSPQIDYHTTPFVPSDGTMKKVVASNAYPIVFPTTCYKFDLNFSGSEKPWDYCRSLLSHDIIAIPCKGSVFAWGTKQDIVTACADRLSGNISVTSFTREMLIANGVFQEMLVRALATVLARNSSLFCSKDKIWDQKKKYSCQVGNKVISAFCGVHLTLQLDFGQTYLTYTPTYVFCDREARYSKEEIKQFSDDFSQKINNGKPNLNIQKYIHDWSKRLTSGKTLEVTFPNNSDDCFRFKIGTNSGLIAVNGTYGDKPAKLPEAVQKRIAFRGLECRDPELAFYDTQQNKTINDFHPMRGLINNAPYDYPLNDKLLKSSVSLGVLCPQEEKTNFYSFLSQLNNSHKVKYNVDYVLPYPGFYKAYKTSLDVPVQDSERWLDLEAPSNSSLKQNAIDFGNCINRLLSSLSDQQVDVVLIYIPKEYEPLTSYSDDNEKFDLRSHVKAYAAQKNIATQFVREKTIVSDLQCQIMWAISLAIYVKTGRVPWVVSGLQQSTAFAGIGYSVNKTSSGSNVVVGCSHVYSSDGQGLKYKLAKINDCTFDRRKNPYLSQDEAYRLGMNIKELFYRSFTELPKRVVVHKRTPFKEEEIKGLVESLSSAGITDIELLEINHESDFNCFELTKDFKVDGFPIRRGLCFPLDSKTALLFTHGIAPSVRNPYYKYFQGGKTIPLPLKIVKHYGSGSMTKIATEILGLSKMNWNSFGLYSKLPCTINSSNEIARIGWLLSHYEGTVYDYRYFM